MTAKNRASSRPSLDAVPSESLEGTIAKLQQDLLERDRLLSSTRAEQRELRHRVRNDLMMLRALLELRSREVQESDILRYLIAHINSLAELYRLLDDNSDPVSLDAYLRSLGALMPNVVVESTVASSAPIESDRARLVGLIVNEAVTNAAKHALPKGASGAIRLRVSEADGRYALSISDEGTGFDPNSTVAGLGLKLMQGLARQLGGDLRLDRNVPCGTTVALTFPVPNRSA